MQPSLSLVGRATQPARISLLAVLVVTFAVLCRAQEQVSHEAEFRAFYAEFVAAVRTNDKNKLAELIAFPVKDWSVDRKGNVETIAIKDKAEFLAKYDLFFTPFMRSRALKAKPAPLKDGRYELVWQNADAEFSFEFDYKASHGYRVTSYSVGPL